MMFRAGDAWGAFVALVKGGFAGCPKEVRDGLAFVSLHGRCKYAGLTGLTNPPDFDQARRSGACV